MSLDTAEPTSPAAPRPDPAAVPRPRRRAIAVAAALVVGAAIATVVVTATVAGSGEDGPPRLVDVTEQAGLDTPHGAFRWGVTGDAAAMTSGGACWLDADGDGQLDLYLVSTWSLDEHPRWLEEGGLPRSTLWRNDGGRFTDVGEETGAALEIRGQGCLAADLDGDGATDLYVTSDRSNVLLWNDGDGTFTADDGSAGLDAYGWHTSAAAADVDGDGRLDLFVGGYVDPNAPIEGSSRGFPGSHQPVRDLLLRNTGPGDGSPAVFEVVDDAGLDPDGARYTLGATFSDVDRDGDPDLLVANDTDPNRLYRNDSSTGRFALVDVAGAAGAADDGSGMGVATGDLDGDDADDLVVTNLGSQGHALLAGAARGAVIGYTDGRTAFGAAGFGDGLTGWGASMVDLDGDGALDVVVGNGAIPVTSLTDDAEPLRAYRSDDGRLVDATAAWDLDALPPGNARAVAVADVDGDADPDVLVTSVGGPPRLLATVGHDGAGWLVVDPAGRVPGTVVEVELPDGRVLRRELRAGSSYLSTEDPRALFGVGPVEEVPRVTVRWPDGAIATAHDVATGRTVALPRP